MTQEICPTCGEELVLYLCGTCGGIGEIYDSDDDDDWPAGECETCKGDGRERLCPRCDLGDGIGG